MILMASRKRSGSGSKRPKEKVVYIYELLFRGDNPVNNNEFWDSFFLLQPNVESLENELTKLTNEQMVLVKENIKLLFNQSIQMLESGNFSDSTFDYLISYFECSFFVFQIIRKECPIAYKHCAPSSTRYSKSKLQTWGLM